MLQYYGHVEAPFMRRNFDSLPADLDIKTKKQLCKFVDLAKPRNKLINWDGKYIAMEKVDGSNRYISWDGERLELHGKTPKTSIADWESQLLDLPELERKFEDTFGRKEVGLYCELVGKHGNGKIYSDDDSEHHYFIFDVRVGNKFLDVDNVVDIAESLCMEHCPVIAGERTIEEWVEFIKSRPDSLVRFNSKPKTPTMEGIVIHPTCGDLYLNGERVIYKIKVADYQPEE